MSVTAIYERISQDATGERAAVERQDEDCLKACQQRGWDENVVRYIDNGVSATKRKPRPEYVRLLADMEAGKVQRVVVWHLDRLHRIPAELEGFMTLAEKHQVELATYTGEVDLATPSGRFFARQMGIMARYEMEQKSERQKRANRQRAEDGLPWCPTRPFGYAKGGLEEHPVEADLVRSLYAQVLAGVPVGTLARQLNAIPVTTTRGNAWRQNTLAKTLANPRYAGLRAYQGDVIKAAKWPGLVSEEEWRSAARIVTSVKITRRSADNLATGIVLCGQCGGPCWVAYDAKSHGRIYRCSAAGCGRSQRDADKMDRFVTQAVLARFARADAADLLTDRDAPDFEKLHARASALRAKLDDLAHDYEEDVLTRSEWKILRDGTMAKLKVIEESMTHVSVAPVLAPLVQAESAEEAWSAMDLAQQRTVAATMLRVTLLPVVRKGRPAKGVTELDVNSVNVRWLV